MWDSLFLHALRSVAHPRSGTMSVIGIGGDRRRNDRTENFFRRGSAGTVMAAGSLAISNTTALPQVGTCKGRSFVWIESQLQSL